VTTTPRGETRQVEQPTPPGTVLLHTAAVATLLGLRPQTLRKWRLVGRGPRYVRLGESCFARVTYRLADIQDWLAERTFANTTEETVCKDGARGSASTLGSASRVPRRSPRGASAAVATPPTDGSAESGGNQVPNGEGV
jgi:predicted DNA-binding transcriptional regulator AlpA